MTPWQHCEVETAYLFNVCAPKLRGKKTSQGAKLMFCKSFGCKSTPKCSWFNTLAMLYDHVSILSRLSRLPQRYAHIAKRKTGNE